MTSVSKLPPRSPAVRHSCWLCGSPPPPPRRCSTFGGPSEGGFWRCLGRGESLVQCSWSDRGGRGPTLAAVCTPAVAVVRVVPGGEHGVHFKGPRWSVRLFFPMGMPMNPVLWGGGRIKLAGSAFRSNPNRKDGRQRAELRTAAEMREKSLSNRTFLMDGNFSLISAAILNSIDLLPVYIYIYI